MEDVYHRFAHRQRVELVRAYNEESVKRYMGRLGGDEIVTPARGYEGPGEGVGNRVAPLTFYGPGPATLTSRPRAWKKDGCVDDVPRPHPAGRNHVRLHAR